MSHDDDSWPCVHTLWPGGTPTPQALPVKITWSWDPGSYQAPDITDQHLEWCQQHCSGAWAWGFDRHQCWLGFSLQTDLVACRLSC